MGDTEGNSFDKFYSAQEELKELQAKEYKANLMILYKDKEIAKLYSQLNDIEKKITLNKKSYSQSNSKTALLNPLIIEEFEYMRKDLLEIYQKIKSDTMENYFRKHSEANPPTVLNQLVKFMEKTSSDVINEVSEGSVESLNSKIKSSKETMADLEQKLRENRNYIKHLESELTETEDLIIALHAKISQIDTQCEEIRKENLKLNGKSDFTNRKRH